MRGDERKTTSLGSRAARWWLRGAAVAVAAASVALAPMIVAQPAPPAVSAAPAAAPPAHPSAKASAAPAKSAKASASSAPSAAASGPPSASAAASAPTDDAGENPHAMPPGHPGVPHGQAGMRPRQSPDHFEPPDDDIRETPDLPPGSISLTIRDRDDLPVAGVHVVVGVLHSSIAKGDTHEKFERTSDAEGKVDLENLDVGTANSYRVTANIGPAIYELPAFQLSEKAGQRGSLHVYDATETLEDTRAFTASSIRTSIKDDTILIRWSVQIRNPSAISWLADTEIPLPAGFKAFQAPDENDSGPLRIYETKNGAVLRGTAAPGDSLVQFAFQVPLSGEATQSIDFDSFPMCAVVEVIAEASKKMTLQADDFSPAKFTKDEQGVTVLYSMRQASADKGLVKQFTVKLGGLPTRGGGSYVAVLLAAVALMTAAAYRLSRRNRSEMPSDTLHDLLEAKETLIREIAALEKAKAKGLVGPQTYERSRGLLLDALARIVARIDGPPSDEASAVDDEPPAPKRTKKRKPGATRAVAS